MSVHKEAPKNPRGHPPDASLDSDLAQLRGLAEQTARATESPKIDLGWPAEARRAQHLATEARCGQAVDNARLFEQAQWAQNALKRSNEELRRANKDLEVFAYAASHDLKDPLRTIAISAQFIKRKLRPSPAERGLRLPF